MIVVVLCFFLTMLLVSLQCVIVAFPCHTHLLYNILSIAYLLYLSVLWLNKVRLLSVQSGGSVVVDLLLYVPPIVCGGSVFVFVLAYVAMCPSSFAIVLTRKRELVVLLQLSY